MNPFFQNGNGPKNILITGASSGIGRKIAEYLHSKGYTVVGTSRNIKNKKFPFHLYELDVCNQSSVDSFIEKVMKDFGSIDVLINNAGNGVTGPLETTTLDDSKYQFEANYFGVLRMIKGVLPIMRSQNQGIILNISSIGGLIGLPFMTHYAGSKFALEGMIEGLRFELRPFNIQVSNICPGDFKTSFSEHKTIAKDIPKEYESAFLQMNEHFVNGEKNGHDPIMIAKLVHKVISSKKDLKVRYLVGGFEEKFGVFLKRLFGSSLFEKIMVKAWKF